MNNIEELKKAALGANLHGWTGFEDALNADGYSEAVSKFIGHCSPSEILALIAQLEAAQKERDDLLNQEFQQRLANAEHQLYMKDLAIHNIKASRKAQFRKRLAAEAALSAANERLLVPGVLCCAKCSFQLAKTNLYMASGTTGPGDNKTEPCPNGCGPLWPVTWEQWSREIGVQLDRYFDEAKELREKLANPVVLNTSDVMSRNYITKAIKAAGFTVEGE
ncbi:hypothetical protein [Yersinia aldovae]|uniref:hypothetical protein n=1 Tax=Yersinia aldovae TaxID=29483 RepID=UPI0005ACF7E0|nr:hypothetical protein [Yersinia aldovae]AJJ63956.1 hypothetical protein AT01_1361 [Yersinia aldovae 670-83]